MLEAMETLAEAQEAAREQTIRELIQMEKAAGVRAEEVAGKGPGAPSSFLPAVVLGHGSGASFPGAVRALQKSLIARGFTFSEESGYFGRQTEAALKRFQVPLPPFALPPSFPLPLSVFLFQQNPSSSLRYRSSTFDASFALNSFSSLHELLPLPNPVGRPSLCSTLPPSIATVCLEPPDPESSKHLPRPQASEGLPQSGVLDAATLEAVTRYDRLSCSTNATASVLLSSLPSLSSLLEPSAGLLIFSSPHSLVSSTPLCSPSSRESPGSPHLQAAPRNCRR